jgi:phosphatidylserine/phosphatidylglycerophosphate/cardiolipin synthase-like enzyme
MYKKMIIAASLVAFVAQATNVNPFDKWGKRIESSAQTYAQKFPYKLPLQYNQTDLDLKLNLQKVTSTYPEDALDKLYNEYYAIPFNEDNWVYQYPFDVKKQWEILPYSFVGDLHGTSPKKWIKEFNASADLPLKDFNFHYYDLKKLTQSTAYAGNDLELLKTPRSFKKLMEKITSAKSHIFLSTFLFQCDAGTEDLLSLLKDKIKQGVLTYIIVDKTFTLTDRKCHKRLKSMGINVALHNAGKLTKIFHEKIFVVDGDYAIIDGQNLLAAQTKSNGTNNLLNDIGVGVKGPIVSVIAKRFLKHWKKASKVKMNPALQLFYKEQYRRAQSYTKKEAVKNAIDQTKGLCRLVGKEPSKDDRSIVNLYGQTINRSQHYLFFNYIDLIFEKYNGSLIGDQLLSSVIDHLNANPDLRVDMLTNTLRGPADYRLPGEGVDHNLFSKIILFLGKLTTKKPYEVGPDIRAKFNKLIHHKNLNWYSYAQYMHAKTMMADNIWTLIGSYNINESSQNDSYELVLACLDKNLAEEMQESIVIDALNSVPIKY